MANEKRLIDAERRKRVLQNFARHLTECGKMEAAEAVNTLVKGLKLEPTVDAVEVVRCKNCIHWDKDFLWCDRKGVRMADDDFCSYGERRTDGKPESVE